MSLHNEVPEGVERRDASVEDAPAIAELINEATLAEIGSIRSNRSQPGAEGGCEVPSGAVLRVPPDRSRPG